MNESDWFQDSLVGRGSESVYCSHGGGGGGGIEEFRGKVRVGFGFGLHDGALAILALRSDVRRNVLGRGGRARGGSGTTRCAGASSTVVVNDYDVVLGAGAQA